MRIFRRWRARRKAPCTTAGRQRRAWPSFRLRCTSRRPRYTPRCPFAERGPAQSCRPGAPRHRRGITHFRAHRRGEGAGFRAGCHYCGGSDLVLQRWIRPRAQQLLHDGRAAFASRDHKRRPTDILRSACGSRAENGGPIILRRLIHPTPHTGQRSRSGRRAWPSVPADSRRRQFDQRHLPSGALCSPVQSTATAVRRTRREGGVRSLHLDRG